MLPNHYTCEFNDLYQATYRWVKTCLEDNIAVSPTRIMRYMLVADEQLEEKPLKTIRGMV